MGWKYEVTVIIAGIDGRADTRQQVYQGEWFVAAMYNAVKVKLTQKVYWLSFEVR